MTLKFQTKFDRLVRWKQVHGQMVKAMLREEKTVGQLAADYEVHSNMLYHWRD